ncbi:protoporphyrinogen oxidase isoform X2 [Pseudoliparis swirei]|uniref:protoporphyrinogen oxidase isoform X2 n=1 Tax=Pseudoliparis swirei TaxID=2059687 RepID=UPI0024BE79E2|nr:protoporphyrinogen oxidase isoform X2 [Pseudoliparis swirei]
MTTVAVLGGGIGGLAASYYLCKSPQVTKVILLESSSRFGGWLQSTRRADGAVFEHGPRGIRPAGAVGRNTLNMVDDLGLGGEILPVTYSHVASKNRYVGLLRTVPPFSRPLLLSLATEILVKKGKEEDESIHSFVSRRLGKELADIAVDSLCRGVFAGDCRKLSVRSCFPVLFSAEQRRGSLTLGMLLASGPGPVVPPGPLAQRSIEESWAQWSLSRGVESLPEAIAEYLQRSGRVELHREADVQHISPSASGWKISLEDGVMSADHIISALPAKVLASLLPSSCQPLVQLLQGVSTVTVAVVNLEYEGSVLPVAGFGHLLPSSEDRGVLGVVYDSVPFPQHNRPGGPTTRLTVMMGGAWFQEVFGAPEAATEERLLARAAEAVRSHLGVSTAPRWSRVTLQRDCIPQYHLGHHRRVEAIRRFIGEERLPLAVAGASYDGVSVNDVIFSGRTAAQTLGAA